MLFFLCLSSVSADDSFENSTDYCGPIYVVGGDCDFVDDSYSDWNIEDYFIDDSDFFELDDDLDWDEFEFDDFDDDLDWDEFDELDEDYWDEFDDLDDDLDWNDSDCDYMDLDDCTNYNYTTNRPIVLSCCLDDDESADNYLNEDNLISNDGLSLNDLTYDVATVNVVDTNSTDSDTNMTMSINQQENSSQNINIFVLMLMMVIAFLSVI